MKLGFFRDRDREFREPRGDGDGRGGRRGGGRRGGGPTGTRGGKPGGPPRKREFDRQSGSDRRYRINNKILIIFSKTAYLI